MTAKTATKETEPETEVQDGGGEPMLDLSTLAPRRQTVLIRSQEHPDGKLYELKELNDFGIALQQELTRDGAEFDRLWNKDNLTKNDKKRLKLVLDRMFDQVLDAPAAIKGVLSDGQRAQVVLAFTVAPLVTETAAQDQRSTTES